MKLFLTLFLAAFSSGAIAQTMPLHHILRQSNPGETLCAPFFIRASYGLVFAYTLPDGGVKGDAVPFADATIEIVAKDPPGFTRDTLRFTLTAETYENAKACLAGIAVAPSK